MGGRAGVILLSCVCLWGCGESGDVGRTATNDAAGPMQPANLPASQAAFEIELSSIYARDLAAYQAEPNDIAKRQAQDKWDADYCSFVTDHQTFDNWRGSVTQLDQPNVVVIFKFDMANGFTFANDPEDDLSLASPAYKTISALHVGDSATLSGKFGSGALGLCDHLPTKLLSDGQLGETQFYIVLTRIDGASA